MVIDHEWRSNSGCETQCRFFCEILWFRVLPVRFYLLVPCCEEADCCCQGKNYPDDGSRDSGGHIDVTWPNTCFFRFHSSAVSSDIFWCHRCDSFQRRDAGQLRDTWKEKKYQYWNPLSTSSKYGRTWPFCGEMWGKSCRNYGVCSVWQLFAFFRFWWESTKYNRSHWIWIPF